MKFKNYFKKQEIVNKFGAIKISENINWLNIILPKIDLRLPEIENKSKIVILKDRINPIYIQLEDGSKLFFTIDEFKRIVGKPAVGKNLILKMQRSKSDNSSSFSKITYCKVID